jgi:hypothetical protein
MKKKENCAFMRTLYSTYCEKYAYSNDSRNEMLNTRYNPKSHNINIGLSWEKYNNLGK